MKKTRESAILPYNSAKIKEHYLITTFLGGWAVLNTEEFRKLNSLNIAADTTLVDKLRKNRILLETDNLDKITDDFRRLRSNLFIDTGLHIAVVTEYCNLDCLYCQTNKKKKNNMSLEAATGILGYLFASRNQAVRLEFQGGEPLLNWPVVKFLIEHSRKQNKLEKKNLAISLVSNLVLLDKEKIDYLIKHDVEVCTSLDGPGVIHNQNRLSRKDEGVHKIVIGKLKLLNDIYKRKKLDKRIGALLTVTKQSFPYFKQIIDEYVDLGFDSIHLRPINKLGQAAVNWDKIGYTADEFNHFWRKSLDYILELNKKGMKIKEVMTANMLRKILAKKDPFYVDLDSPCGAARSQLAYAPNGDVYTCDEARMLNNDMFKLGNVLKDKFQDVMRNQNLFYTTQSSLLNLWDYNSAFCIWSGTCPVMNFYEQDNPVVKITQTAKHKIHQFQFNYIFEKIIYDQQAYDIFKNWAG